jgi:hypothetical protein
MNQSTRSWAKVREAEMWQAFKDSGLEIHWAARGIYNGLYPWVDKEYVKNMVMR